jgi:hypothetical protein
MTWAAAVAGVGSLLYGLAGMVSQRERATPLSLGRFWLGLFVLIETGPRLAGWPSSVVMVLSGLAFVPLLIAVRQLRQAGREFSSPA